MKIESVIKKFNSNLIYSCPNCSEDMVQNKNSLVCNRKHSYDFSKKGYIHLIPNYKKTKYSTELFLARNYIFSAGYYNHIFEQLEKILEQQNNIKNVLDVGCGDGFYIRKLREKFSSTYFYGLDNSKDAIEVAVKSDKENPYMLSDLTKLPFSKDSIDVILNILTPANYKEFSRILKNSGVLIKIIPTKNYLKEIRELLKISDYNNEEVTNLLEKNFTCLHKEVVTREFVLDKQASYNFLKMTPLTFSKEITEGTVNNLKNITIELEIIVARKK